MEKAQMELLNLINDEIFHRSRLRDEQLLGGTKNNLQNLRRDFEIEPNYRVVSKIENPIFTEKIKINSPSYF